MAWTMTIKTKHFELMYDASRKQAKMSLHSTKEITSIQRLCHGMRITANGQTLHLLNTQLTHYLYGGQHKPESRRQRSSSQNNYDPSKWTSYDN